MSCLGFVQAAYHYLGLFLIDGMMLADIAPAGRLTGPQKARLLAALAGLLILGFAMVLLTWLGGRFTRRYMRSAHLDRAPASPSSTDDWARKPLVPPEKEPRDLE